MYQEDLGVPNLCCQISNMGKKKKKTKKKYISKKTIANQFADDLRKAPTQSAKRFKKLLKATGYRFMSEKIIYKEVSFYIVDFYIPDKNLCIELDGGYHDTPEQREKDFIRDKYLLGRGYQNWRMTNEEAVSMTVEEIKAKIDSFPTKERAVRQIPMAEDRPRIHKPKHLKGNPRSRRSKKKSKPAKLSHPELDKLVENKKRREAIQQQNRNLRGK